MIIMFRVDASIRMGSGHVMRCLTLADALIEKGARCYFICRLHLGNMVTFIESKGYRVLSLPAPEKDWFPIEKRSQLKHASWLGANMADDAAQTLAALQSLNFNEKLDWLVVDHYAIDKSWQEQLKGNYKKLMVIDDLADRKHQCDLLLDQTYDRQVDDYKYLVPEHCQMLLGSQSALLRPEFAQWRGYSLKRRAYPELKKLLITMGGTDPDNVTEQVLEELKNCDLPSDIEIVVVMGGLAPHLENVRKQARSLPYKTEVKSNVSNMAEIMANADLAIGAAGATTWERCCLGLPSILWVFADNQKTIAQNLKAKDITQIFNTYDQLCLGMKALKKDLFGYSRKAASISSGMGVLSAVKVLYE